MHPKIKTYVGFCIKKGSAAIGLASVERCKKKIYLLVMDPGVGANAKKNILRIAREQHVPVAVSPYVGQLSGRDSCKTFALLDEGLVNTILKMLDEDFQIATEEG